MEHSLPTSIRSRLHLCSVLLPPSFSSCTCILLSRFSFPDSLFQTVFLLSSSSSVASTGMLAWQCCHRIFIESVCPSQVHFLRRIWFSTFSPQLHDDVCPVCINAKKVNHRKMLATVDSCRLILGSTADFLHVTNSC